MSDLFHKNLMLVLLALALCVLFFLVKILKNPVRGLYMTFFATGFLLTPNLPVVRDKITAVEVLMTLTWVSVFAARKAGQNSIPLTQNQIKVLVLGLWFVGWIFLSFAINLLIFPVNMVASLVETVNFIYGYFIFLTVVLMVQKWETWWNCIKGWLWGSVVVSFVGVLALAFHAPSWAFDSFSGRVCSTLHTENQVPSFLLPILPILVFMTVEKGRCWRDRMILTVLLGGVFLTGVSSGSRTAFLMMICAALGILFVAMREYKMGAFNLRRFNMIVFFVLIGFFFYIFLALVNYNGDYQLGVTPTWQRPVVMLYDWARGKRNLDDTREHQLAIVSENIGDNLIIGTGPKNYGVEYDVSEIHNTYAGVLFQLGVPGLALLLFWLGLVVYSGWRARRRIRDPHQRLSILCMVVGMMLLLLYSMTMFGLRQRNIWLLAGLLVATDSLAPRKRPLRSSEGQVRLPAVSHSDNS